LSKYENNAVAIGTVSPNSTSKHGGAYFFKGTNDLLNVSSDSSLFWRDNLYLNIS
jgi:hypothetical protein